MPLRMIKELSRRRVFRGGATYVIVAWVVLQFVNAQIDPADPLRRLALIWAVGLFPLAVLFSWVFQVVPGVVAREDHGEAHPPRTGLGRTLDIAAIAGLALIIVVEAGRRLVGG